jgi:hypothetical protein
MNGCWGRSGAEISCCFRLVQWSSLFCKLRGFSIRGFNEHRIEERRSSKLRPGTRLRRTHRRSPIVRQEGATIDIIRALYCTLNLAFVSKLTVVHQTYNNHIPVNNPKHRVRAVKVKREGYFARSSILMLNRPRSMESSRTWSLELKWLTHPLSLKSGAKETS